jgi:hypothetical protein
VAQDLNGRDRQRRFGCWRMRSGATITHPDGISQAAAFEQIVPLLQSWKQAVFMQVPRLEQIPEHPAGKLDLSRWIALRARDCSWSSGPRASGSPHERAGGSRAA